MNTDARRAAIEQLRHLFKQERFPRYFEELIFAKIEREEPSDYWIERAADILTKQVRILQGR